MIIRITKKLASKLKINLPQDEYFNVDAIEDWYGNLFTANRIQYILFTNAYSLYSIIVPGKGIIKPGDFIDIIFSSLYLQLKKDNLEYVMNTYITPGLETVDFTKTKNRGVVGSMNDMISHSKFYISNYQLSHTEVSERLNEIIYGYINYENPAAMLKKLLKDWE